MSISRNEFTQWSNKNMQHTTSSLQTTVLRNKNTIFLFYPYYYFFEPPTFFPVSLFVFKHGEVTKPTNVKTHTILKVKQNETKYDISETLMKKNE